MQATCASSAVKDSDGCIVIADYAYHRVQVMRYRDGTHLHTIGRGSSNAQFNLPIGGIAMDSVGRMVSADICNVFAAAIACKFSSELPTAPCLLPLPPLSLHPT